MKNVLFFLFSHVSTSFQGMTSLSAEQYTSLASETNLSYGGDASSSSLFNSSIIVVLLLLIALVLSILYTILLRRQIKRAKKREKALSEELVEAENRNILVREVGSLAAWKFDVSKDKFFVIAKEVKDKSLIGGVPRDKFFSSLIHPDNRSEMSEVFEKMKSGLISKITIKFQFFTNDEWRWVISSFIAIRENGVLKEIIGDRRDITAEVEYEQSLMAKIAETTKQGDELLQILEDLPIPISLIKFDSKEYSFVNKLGRDEYGVQRGDSFPYKVLSSSVSKLTEEEESNGVYEAIEVLEMANGRQIETLVRSAIVEYKDEKHILISRLDLSKKEVLWRGAESTYMPNMKGYVWHLNNDTDTLSIKHNMALERDISLIKSFEEFVEIVHPEDRVSFMENVEWLKTGDLSDSREFTFRIDIHEIGVYEWWEAFATVTIVMEGGKEVRLLGGIVVNIHDRKKAEIELRALHTQNEMILNNMSSMLIFINNDYEVQWTNTQTLMGEDYSKAYQQGSKCYETFGHSAPCEGCAAREAMHTGLVKQKQIDMPIIPGGDIYEATATPIIGDNGVEGAVIKLDNISDRKKYIAELSSTNQLMSTLLNELPTAFFIKDINDDFRYLLASSGFCKKVANKPLQEIIGFTDYEIFEDQESAEKFRADDILVAKNIDGNIINLGEEVIYNNGGSCVVETQKLYLKLLNGKELLIGQCFDITETKRINEQLQLATEKAIMADKLKSAFLANMSHEIRTPLNAIVGFSELLQAAEDDVEKETYMQIINTNNELLLRLISDILDLSKIESGLVDLCPETFDFSETFNEAYTTLKPRCEKSEVELRCFNPFSKCVVTLDKNRCLQILTNYLNNAVKFTQKGWLQMGYDYIDDGLIIFVQDTGIGVSAEKMDLLFRRFEKLDDFAQGTGLGLSICKAIAESMGGRVWAESEVGKGSTFSVWIPCEAEIEMETFSNPIEDAAPADNGDDRLLVKTKNVLVVEDNNSNYLYVKSILKNCNITRALNGEAAVAYAKQFKYDVILMDMKMPVMGGLDATKKIREFDKDTLIIAVTANAFDSDRIDALEAGCNIFIPKPIKRRDLEAALFGNMISPLVSNTNGKKIVDL